MMASAWKLVHSLVFSRLICVATQFITTTLDGLCSDLGLTIPQLQSTLGRVAARQVESLYIANLMCDWVDELIEAIKGGDSEYFRSPSTLTGDGTGFWEAPRGALSITPSMLTTVRLRVIRLLFLPLGILLLVTLKAFLVLSSRLLSGTPVADLDMPINALRTVHSFDPCTACAVHITEPSTGKHFETVTSPWGVK